MLARLTGLLEHLTDRHALLALPGGEAYEALISSATAQRLAPRRGESVTLHTLELLEQDSPSRFIPRLIAFATPEEKRFFELFTTVKGVGPKKALRAMAAEPTQIASAISRRDMVFLQTLPEIGKRLAETICAELSGKVDDMLVGAHAEPKLAAPAGGPAEQAVAALVRLGETRQDAERLVARATQGRPALDTPDAILAAAFSSRGG